MNVTKEESRGIVLQGPIDEPGFECQEIPRPWHGKAEVLADLGEMFTAGLLTAGVALKRLRPDFELVGDETDGGGGATLRSGGTNPR